MPGGGYSPLQSNGSVPLQQTTEHVDNGNTDSSTDWTANFDTMIITNRYKEDTNHDCDGISSHTSLANELLHGSITDRSLSHGKSSSSPLHTKPRDSHHPQTSNQGSTAKYTALRPTSVRELSTDEEIPESSLPTPYLEDTELDDLQFYGSEIRVNLIRDSSSKISRFHIILCGLLVAACAVVGLGLLYVFVILPAHRGTILSPGGKAPSADITKLKHLGPNVAVTKCGLVRGTFENGAHVFRGIPYAVPPVASLRWKAPVPRSYESGTCWHDVLNTTLFGNVCAQPVLDTSGGKRGANTAESKNSRFTKTLGDENCLYLNVWTPSLNPPNLLPVLVWIHSGDFLYGSGHAKGMTPSADLAARTGAVYISFNYRLGVFGFLAVDALREKRGLPLDATGNYGIMDQQLALQWVKHNAHYFGGDPFKVTVFGHGSGATSIQALLLSSASSGLFNAAWLTSPVALLNKTVDEACKDNQPIMTRSRCSDGHCLRKLDTETLIKLSPWSLEPWWTLDQLLDNPTHTQLRNALPIFDGHVVHWDSMKHGPVGPAVSVVVGATYSDLGGLITDVPVTNLTWDQLDSLLVHQLSPVGIEAVVQIKSRYSQMSKVGYSVLSSPKPANDEFFPLPSRQFARFLRDIEVVCPSKILADKLNTLFADTAPVYLYTSEAFPSHDLNLENRLSSLSASTDNLFIGWDMVAFFGSFRELGFRERQSDVSFQDIVRQEVLSLARDGKPNAARWHTEEVNTGLLRSEVTVSPAPANYFDSCDSFQQYGFFDYTWTKH